jgi:hypothetical protein
MRSRSPLNRNRHRQVFDLGVTASSTPSVSVKTVSYFPGFGFARLQAAVLSATVSDPFLTRS